MSDRPIKVLSLEIGETCASLACEPDTPAEIQVYVFTSGGSYPLWVCSEEHFQHLKASAPEGIDVIKAKARKEK